MEKQVDSNSSLDRLAHIANMTQELHELNRQIKEEKTPEPDLKNLDSKFKPRKLACTWCRQQKSKCDAQERMPGSCTRCEKKGLQCQMKPDFKRTERRARIALIEKEFAELKKSFMAPGASLDILKTAPTLSTEGTPQTITPLRYLPMSRIDSPDMPEATLTQHVHVPERSVPQQIVPVPQTVVPEHALLCEEKVLDSVALLPTTIRLLYLEYCRAYHPFLPVVDVVKGPERIYRLCPALFWVIMFVALRRFDDDKSLLLRLSPLIKDILSEITISPITRYNPTEEDEPIMNACSVYSVQAFVLYTLWPPLTSSLSADSSWNTIGVALFQAIRIGLHSLGQILDSKSTPQQLAMAQEQMKTWIVCNIVAQNIATSFGFPAFVQFDSLRANLVDIPLSTRRVMEVAHFEDQVAKTLDLTSGEATERLALLKVLLRQLDDLELKVSADANDDGYRKLQYIGARVHLLTHYFLDAPSIPPVELSKGLVRLYNAAISLVTHLQLCQAKNKNFVKYLPVVAVLNVWQASCVIVKLVHSPLKAVIDIESGRHTYQNAISLVARASILKHDIAYRASGIMRNMWQLFRTLDEKNMTTLTINIRSRMAASLFFDCLSLLRDQVGMAKLTPSTDVRDNAENDNNYAAVSSEDEDGTNSGELGNSASDSPTSPDSSASSKNRKKRALSNLEDAESKARRIIRTIPLDPQPISALKRSSIFKIVNSDTSPSVRADDSHGSSVSTPAQREVTRIRPAVFAEPVGAAQSPRFPEVFMGFQELPTQQAENLELDVYGVNSDLLWKDVDSLMNDFGFHT